MRHFQLRNHTPPPQQHIPDPPLSVSTGVRLTCVALQSHRRTDEGTGVAAAQSDVHRLLGQRLHDVAHQSRTRHAIESRRDQLTERFFQRNVLPETSCLHYLLPDKIPLSGTDCDIQ